MGVGKTFGSFDVVQILEKKALFVLIKISLNTVIEASLIFSATKHYLFNTYLLNCIVSKESNRRGVSLFVLKMEFAFEEKSYSFEILFIPFKCFVFTTT